MEPDGISLSTAIRPQVNMKNSTPAMTPRERLHCALSPGLPDRFPLRLFYATSEQIQRLWPDGPPGDPVEALRWEHERYLTHGMVPGGFLRPVVYDDGNHYRIECETGPRMRCHRHPIPNTHTQSRGL